MRVWRKIAMRFAAVGVAVAMTTGLTATAAQAAKPWHGCPVGAACLFSGLFPSELGPIKAIWWDGPYNLQAIYGNHLLMNNQTDNWAVDICWQYNAQDCRIVVPAGFYHARDFTPINSVRLHPWGQ